MQAVENFRKSLQFVLQHEVGGRPNGGYTNDRSDQGGETKYGISGVYHPNVSIKDLTPEQAAQIYADEYWDAAGCDQLSFPLCTAVFDTAVVCGVSRSLAWLKQSENAYQFINYRRMHHYDVVNKKPAQGRFLTGWLNRCGDLRKFLDINSSLAVVPDPMEPVPVPKWGSLG